MNYPHDELPESARRAFDSYPQLEPSRAFNRAVLDALALEQAKRKRTLVGRIEEFLGLGLWSFAASGALGAVLPAAILGATLFSGRAASTPNPQPQPSPLGFPLNRYAGPLYARELEDLRRAPYFSLPARPNSKEFSCFQKSPVA